MATILNTSKMSDLEDSGNSKRMFGPLSFEETSLEKYSPVLQQECLLCNEKFSLKNELESFLKHIFEQHHLIIEDFQSIERLDKYVEFWRVKFQQTPIETINPAVKIEDTNQFYFIISDLLKDDKHIRHKLKLESVLEQQEQERLSDNFKKTCLFCKLEFEGKITDYVKHLSTQHNLQLGRPENLVYIKEFLEEIEEKLNSLKCIYCEKTFTDRNVLKEHMRKKLHKRINPANHFYDKFYIVNYLELDKNWQNLQKEDNLPISLEDNSDLEWADWNDKDQEIVCLFCDFKDNLLINLCDHMKRSHNFDFQSVFGDLEYYQKVKLVNYIRRQMHVSRCIYCDKYFEEKQNLIEHLNNDKHYLIPDIKTFDQPEFYFPTYENDALLYYLEEIQENDE